MAKRVTPREGIRPSYELRASKAGAGNLVLEIWQLPSRATPEVRQPHYIGGNLRERPIEALWREARCLECPP